MSNRATIITKLFALLFVTVCGIAAIVSVTHGQTVTPPTPSTLNENDNGQPVLAIDGSTGSANRFSYQLEVNKKETLNVGETTLLLAKTMPNQPRASIIWGCDKPEVLALTSDGFATGISPGEANVTVMVIDPDNYNAPSETFRVVVTDSLDASAFSLAPGEIPGGNRELPIANISHSCSSDYVPQLVSIGDSVPRKHPEQDMQCTREALAAYIQMYVDMQNDGVGPLFIISAYRSYDRQSQLLAAEIKKHIDEGLDEKAARAEAVKTVQPPGASEHQLGVSLDVSTDGQAQKDFMNYPQGVWLARNAYKYGFIIRYPFDKVDLTGINFEPWHLRYVGMLHAMYMHEYNLCLEEYVVL